MLLTLIECSKWWMSALTHMIDNIHEQQTSMGAYKNVNQYIYYISPIWQLASQGRKKLIRFQTEMLLITYTYH